MSKLETILKEIFENCLEFEVYDNLHSLIINRYKRLKDENACRRSSMSIARTLNKGENKVIDVVLDEANLYG